MIKQKNVYLIAGGNWYKPGAILPIFKKIISHSGKSGPDVAYIGTANGDSFTFFKFSSNYIKKAGAGAITQIFLADKNADVKQAKKLLRKADVIFIAGGDVEEGMLWLKKHKIVPLLKELYKKGVLFFGLSAGSIMLGTKWIRWNDPEDDSSAELFDCIGIVPILCDTHAEKDKWEELKMAIMLLGRNSKGYGIPSGGVICAAPDGSFTAMQKTAVCYAKRGGQVVKESDIAAAGK